jgi:hypothetical protein
MKEDLKILEKPSLRLVEEKRAYASERILNAQRAAILASSRYKSCR